MDFFHDFSILSGMKKEERIHLVTPSPEWKDVIMDYKREFLEHEDTIPGAAGLDTADTFEDWYGAMCDNLNEETVRAGLVPASTFLVISYEGRLVGMIDIRHRLSDFLFHFGGHIGYNVRKSERRKGYATEMLALGLMQCKELGIDRVLITCDRENIASMKTILKNGGILENEVPHDGKIIVRYWIDCV